MGCDMDCVEFEKAISDLPVGWQNYLIKAREVELQKDGPLVTPNLARKLRGLKDNAPYEKVHPGEPPRKDVVEFTEELRRRGEANRKFHEGLK